MRLGGNLKLTLDGLEGFVPVANASAAIGATGNYVFPDGSTFKFPYTVIKQMPPYNTANAVSKANWWDKFFNSPDPRGTFTEAPIKYTNLKEGTVGQFGINTFFGPVFQPHYTTSLSWLTGGPVLNMGAPSVVNDSTEFLRSALIDSDWDRVFAWYGYYIKSIWDTVSHAHSAFFGLSQLNLADYKYVVNPDGTRTYFPFSLADLNSFVKKVQARLKIIDTGRATAAFGFLDGNGAAIANPTNAQLFGGMDGALLTSDAGRGVYLDGNSWVVSNPFSRYTADAAAGGWASRRTPYTSLLLGWKQGPAGPWDFGSVSLIILGAVVTAGFASGLSSAFAAPAAAAAPAPVAVAAPAIIVPAAAVAPAAIAAPAVIETVITTASVVVPATITAGSVAAGVAAGALTAVAAAPPILASSPTGADIAPIETVTSLSTAIPAAAGAGVPVTVAAGISAGVVAATAVAPPISAATTATPPAPDAPIETVQVTAPKYLAPTTNAPAVIATVASNAASALEQLAQTTPQPHIEDQSNWHQGLDDAVKKYGWDYVRAHLGQLLANLLGHSPSPAELTAADDYLNGGGLLAKIAPWMLGGVLALALLIPDKKKGAAHGTGKKNATHHSAPRSGKKHATH